MPNTLLRVDTTKDSFFLIFSYDFIILYFFFLKIDFVVIFNLFSFGLSWSHGLSHGVYKSFWNRGVFFLKNVLFYIYFFKNYFPFFYIDKFYFKKKIYFTKIFLIYSTLHCIFFPFPCIVFC
jgi:hypothetical protein